MVSGSGFGGSVRDGGNGMSDPLPSRPEAKVCGQCGEVCDDWVWDEQDQEWENDFEWWSHKASGHGFLCSRWCWVKVHQAHCGEGNPCRAAAG